LLRIYALATKQVNGHNPAKEVARFRLENSHERELSLAEEDQLRAKISTQNAGIRPSIALDVSAQQSLRPAQH
jgi:hypothetical protein